MLHKPHIYNAAAAFNNWLHTIDDVRPIIQERSLGGWNETTAVRST